MPLPRLWLAAPAAVVLSACAQLADHDPLPVRPTPTVQSTVQTASLLPAFRPPPADVRTARLVPVVPPAPDEARTGPRPRLKAAAPLRSLPPRYNTVGVASWYGPKFHGRLTASGDVYDMNGLTAAHRSLPFGTEVVVTNLDNNRTLSLTINDRGPFVGRRVIDVSYQAAVLLGFVDDGLTDVRIVEIE